MLFCFEYTLFAVWCCCYSCWCCCCCLLCFWLNALLKVLSVCFILLWNTFFIMLPELKTHKNCKQNKIRNWINRNLPNKETRARSHTHTHTYTHSHTNKITLGKFTIFLATLSFFLFCIGLLFGTLSPLDQSVENWRKRKKDTTFPKSFKNFHQLFLFWHRRRIYMLLVDP